MCTVGKVNVLPWWGGRTTTRPICTGTTDVITTRVATATGTATGSNRADRFVGSARSTRPSPVGRAGRWAPVIHSVMSGTAD